MVLNRLAYGRVQDVLILCVGRLDVDEHDLSSWLERLSVSDYRHLLISSHGGGGFTSKQRSRVGDFWKQPGRKPPRVALLSDSAVARGVATAISWLLDNPTRAFSPQDVAGALAFLGTSVPAIEITRQLEQLRDALDKNTQRSA